ncbi:TRAM domain-containing protein [Halomonas sp. M20]|uniref:TRAM domain-containing protein n=1 Tax=Halomonas sp. M20 TaxID=2763264 RepID=UPI001D0B98C7|nr:TRAM domain-containing protein [Halomonas sp. M20]
MAMLGKRRPSRRPGQRISAGAKRKDPAPDGAAISDAIKEERAGDVDENGVDILRLAHDGRGIAKDDAGKTLFVDQALPGERVRVAIHRSRKRFDEAHLRELVTSSADRVSPPCSHYGQCGGCDLQHLALQAQRRHKCDALIDQLARQGVALEVSPTLLAGEGFGYRRRARLGVKVDAQGQVHLGFRARGSRHLVDVAECSILVPPLAALLNPLRQHLATLQAPRQVGHVELLAGDDELAVVVRQLRANADDAEGWRQWGDANKVSVGLLQGRGNPRLDWLGKTPRLRYTLSHTQQGSTRDLAPRPLELYFGPGDFLQVNAEVNREMVATALEWLEPDKNDQVLDLFAGVGNFSLALAPRVAKVTSVEGSLAMVERLRRNARHNGLDNVDARLGNLDQSPALDSHPHSVVLDPPRSGAEAVCRTLAGSGIKRILYVSCDPATLARDAGHLLQGGYRITRAAVADMFAQTAHLEAMLLFEGPSA